MVILLTGLPGAGKSHLAKELAPQLSADILDRDVIRDAIFPDHDLDYSAAQNELASQVTYRVAEYILQRAPQRVVILDGRPYSKRAQVDEVIALAARVDHQLCVIYCWAPDEVVRQRLARDLRETGNVAADRSMQKYLRIKRCFEPLTVPHLTVDTSQPMTKTLKDVLKYLDSPVQ